MHGSSMKRLTWYAWAVVQISNSPLARGFVTTSPPLVSWVSPSSSRPGLLGAATRSTEAGSLGVFNSSSSSSLFSSSSSSSPSSSPSVGSARNTPLSPLRRRTLYEVLDAAPTATRAELKQKYVEKAKVSHPDAQIGSRNNNNNNNNERDDPSPDDFGEVAAAWRILGDSKSRKRYDRELQYKEWAEFASKYANEKMEEAVPAVARMMDDLALPFLRRTAATTVAVSQVVSNMAKTVDSSSSFSSRSSSSSSRRTPSQPNDNKNLITDAFMNAVRAGQKAGRAIDTLELNEKSAQLSQRAQHEEKRAMELQEELVSVTQQRLMATLQSDKTALSSEEARQVLEHMASSSGQQDTDRKQQNVVQRIEKEIDALQQTEQIFVEKLRTYQQTDVEWKTLLSRQESFRDNLTQRKREEADARRRLDDAIRSVSEAKANLVAVSSPLRNMEHLVRRHASEIDQVKFTLSKKQDRLRQALRKKATHMSNGAIQLHYMTEEDLAALRRKEMQLSGESEQLATMVARMSARAEKLKSRADLLDSLQDLNGRSPQQEAPPSLGDRPFGP